MKTTIGFPKKKTITKSKAKAKAWKAFSLYIRKKDANNMGMVDCYTCGKRLFWKESQAGHGIPGRNNSVLFMEDIVRTQCKGCNIFGRGKQSIFTMKLIKEMGMKKYEALVNESNEIVQYKTSDFQELERFFKNKLAELKGSI